MREGTLPSTVDVPCGTINHTDGQGTGRMNADGGSCDRDASRFVKDDDGDVEVLTCGHHVERARNRFEEMMA